MDDSNEQVSQAFGRSEYPKIRCKHLPFFERVGCKIKRFATIVYRGFKHSSYLQTIIVLLILILIINFYLIYNGHFNEDGDRPDVKTGLTDTLYFTTTQFTTIGYGDMGPKTKISRIITSIIHMSVLFISLKLAEEFGVLNNPQKIMSRDLKESHHSYVAPIKPKVVENNVEDWSTTYLDKPVTLTSIN